MSTFIGKKIYLKKRKYKDRQVINQCEHTNMNTNENTNRNTNKIRMFNQGEHHHPRAEGF